MGDLLDKPVAHGGQALSRSAALAACIVLCLVLFRQRAEASPGNAARSWDRGTGAPCKRRPRSPAARFRAGDAQHGTRLCVAVPICAGLAPLRLHAELPFVTDDPVPAEPGGWEINRALFGTLVQGGGAAGLPGIDANCGILPGVQFHVQPKISAVWAPGQRAAGFCDAVLQYQFTKRFSPAPRRSSGRRKAAGRRVHPGFNLGGSYDLSRLYQVLVSAGRGLANQPAIGLSGATNHVLIFCDFSKQECCLAQVAITLANGRHVSFDVGQDGPQPPCFLLGMRKCGSTIVNHICAVLAAANQRQFVNVGHTFFSENIPSPEWSRDPALRQIIRSGTIYGGFRNMPQSLEDDPAFVAAPKLLVIRDPRDALVSDYFSNAFSHPIPAPVGGADGVTKMLEAQRAMARAETIQTTVVKRARGLARDFLYYAAALAMPGMLVLKYEDIILDKAILIEKMAAHFGLQAGPAAIRDILEWADVRPVDEDPHAFIRQVTPGDHRRKLDPATIAVLNRELAKPMQMFGYVP